MSTNQYTSITPNPSKSITSRTAQNTSSRYIPLFFFIFSIISTITTTYNLLYQDSSYLFPSQTRNKYIFYIILPFLLVIIASLYLACLIFYKKNTNNNHSSIYSSSIYNLFILCISICKWELYFFSINFSNILSM